MVFLSLNILLGSCTCVSKSKGIVMQRQAECFFGGNLKKGFKKKTPKHYLDIFVSLADVIFESSQN